MVIILARLTPFARLTAYSAELIVAAKPNLARSRRLIYQNDSNNSINYANYNGNSYANSTSLIANIATLTGTQSVSLAMVHYVQMHTDP